MPANARKDIVREGEIGTYHCWSRCVQRAFLCGYDPVTQRDFDYRRGWIEELLAYLAQVFAVDVGNYSVLSNHLHALLRTRPDLAACSAPEELALRWKMAWPEFHNGRWVREPTDAELDQLLADPEKIEKIRRRLSSLSWFMARWKEPIARLCNAEMETSGHFWDARFCSRELLDDEAVVTCNIYVDLNQIRAGLADSLEASRHSAIRQRILAAKEREAQTSWEDVQTRENPTRDDFSLAQAQRLFADCFLAPIAATGPLLTMDALLLSQSLNDRVDTAVQPVAAELILPANVSHAVAAAAAAAATDTASATSGSVPDPAASPPDPEAPPAPESVPRRRLQLTRRRASDSPFIGVAISEYMRVVQALANRILSPPPTPDGEHDGAEDAALCDTLTRWGMNPAAWLAGLHQLDRQCLRALGRVDRVLERAQAVARQRFHGVSFCRALFAATAPDGFT